MKDFFTRYRESRKNPVIIPAIFGLALGFGVVASLQNTPIDLKSISANVVSGIEQKTSYPADFIMEREGNTLKFVIGKDAENVKSIHFSLLGNPANFTQVESNHPTTSISMNEPGVALIQVSINNSMKAGQVITTLTPTLSGETPLAIVDAGFTSESGEYALSVKGE